MEEGQNPKEGPRPPKVRFRPPEGMISAVEMGELPMEKAVGRQQFGGYWRQGLYRGSDLSCHGGGVLRRSLNATRW